MYKSVHKKGELSRKAMDWLRDYAATQPQLRAIRSMASAVEGEVRAEARQAPDPLESWRQAVAIPRDPPVAQPNQAPSRVLPRVEPSHVRGSELPSLRRDQMVIKPRMFDGNKPPPRRWIDDFEKAAHANGWTDHFMVTFFVSFLSGHAYDWLVTLGRRRLPPNPRWMDIKEAFIRHYLGESYRSTIRKQIEKLQQGPQEKCVNFIPKVVRLYELVEPSKPEEELVEAVRDKLRPEFAAHLVMQSIYTLEQLNDCCIKIEQFLERSRANKQQKKDDKPKGKSPSDSEKKQGGSKTAPWRFPPRRCYRCDRVGHMSPDCRYTSKQDGSALNRKPVNTVQQVEQAQPPTELQPTAARASRPADSVNTIIANLAPDKLDKLANRN